MYGKLTAQEYGNLEANIQFMLKVINPDKLPLFLKTNFFIKSKKKVEKLGES